MKMSGRFVKGPWRYEQIDQASHWTRPTGRTSFSLSGWAETSSALSIPFQIKTR
jgi:hypothetical protein